MRSRSDDQAIRALFQHSSGLFNFVQEFNVYPALYIHPSWIEGYMPVDLFNVLKQSPRGVAKLSRLILDQYDLNQNVCYNFDDPSRRLALIKPEDLATLAFYCGVALNHKRIATMLNKKKLSDIKKSIGERAYVFAVKRAPLLLGGVVSHNESWNTATDFKQYAERCGTRYLLTHLTHLPGSIFSRLLLKFPKGLMDQIPIEDDLPRMNGWFILKRILLNEIDSTWRPLFS